MHTNALIESAANVTSLKDLAPENTADIQLDNNIIMQPKGSKMKTREKLQLLLNKIPEPGCGAHRESGIMNNLLSTSSLVDTDCEVFLYGTGYDISYNGEVIVGG